MRIDPIDSSTRETAAPLPREVKSTSPPEQKADAAPVSNTPATSTPASKSPASFQSPQHEVNMVLDDSRNIVYRIVDKQTGEVVQQMPPEELLRMMKSIQALLEKSEQKLKVTL